MDSSDRLNSSGIPVSPTPLPGVLTDDLFWQLIRVVLALDLAVGVLATGANVFTIIVYLRMGFSDSTNISLTALAISDCGIAVTAVSLTLCNLLPSVMSTFFTNDSCMSTSAVPHSLLARISALITMYLTIERYLCVRLPLKIKTIITPTRTFCVMVIIITGLFCLYPMGFIASPVGWTFDAETNRTVLDILPVAGAIKSLLEGIFTVIVAIIIPFFTFFIVVLCTILLSLSLQKSKAWRDKNKNTSSTGTDIPDKDSKLPLKKPKEIRAVKMMITIAIVFIVSSIPSCIHVILAMVVPGFSVYGRFSRLFDLIGMFSVGVNSINSGVNVIIYYRMSNKFRQAMRGVVCK